LKHQTSIVVLFQYFTCRALLSVGTNQIHNELQSTAVIQPKYFCAQRDQEYCVNVIQTHAKAQQREKADDQPKAKRTKPVSSIVRALFGRFHVSNSTVTDTCERRGSPVVSNASAVRHCRGFRNLKEVERADEERDKQPCDLIEPLLRAPSILKRLGFRSSKEVEREDEKCGQCDDGTNFMEQSFNTRPGTIISWPRTKSSTFTLVENNLELTDSYANQSDFRPHSAEFRLDWGDDRTADAHELLLTSFNVDFLRSIRRSTRDRMALTT
jgi:hypothetical protein